jgi:hypothetical protein
MCYDDATSIIPVDGLFDIVMTNEKPRPGISQPGEP